MRDPAVRASMQRLRHDRQPNVTQIAAQLAADQVCEGAGCP